MKRLTNSLLEEMRDACYLTAISFEIGTNKFVYLIRFRFLVVTVYFFVDATGNYISRPHISKKFDQKKKASTLYNFCKDNDEINPWILFPECNLGKIVTTGVALARSIDIRNGIEIEQCCPN